MHDIIELLKTLLANPDKLMAFIGANGGLIIVMAIVFAETGLFVGFFLPGDSLLFIAGILLKTTNNPPFDTGIINLVFWLVVISIAAVVGNMVGYWLGNKSGHLWFERKDSWLFKRKHLVQAHDFYEKKGSIAIIMGRFLPIVRTFAPLVAGIVSMSYKKFFSYSIIGAVAWVVSMTMAGYLLSSNEFVKHNLEKIVIAIIIVTTAPVIFKMFFGKKEEAKTP